MQKHVFIALLVLVSPVALLAQSNDIGVFVSVSSYSSARSMDPDMPGHNLKMDLEEGTGVGVSYNRYWTPAFSTELAMIRLKGDRILEMSNGMSQGVVKRDEVELQIISAIPQWHFRNGGPVAPFAGLGVARIDGSDGLKSETTWIANAGVAYAITPVLSVAVDAKYMPYEPDGVNVEPFVASAGVHFRF